MSKFLKLLEKYNNLLNEEDLNNEVPQMQEQPNQTSAMPDVDGNLKPESEPALVTLLSNLLNVMDFKNNIDPQIKISIEQELKSVNGTNVEDVVNKVSEKLQNVKLGKEIQKQQDKITEPSTGENQPKDVSDPEL